MITLKGDVAKKEPIFELSLEKRTGSVVVLCHTSNTDPEEVYGGENFTWTLGRFTEVEGKLAFVRESDLYDKLFLTTKGSTSI